MGSTANNSAPASAEAFPNLFQFLPLSSSSGVAAVGPQSLPGYSAGQKCYHAASTFFSDQASPSASPLVLEALDAMTSFSKIHLWTFAKPSRTVGVVYCNLTCIDKETVYDLLSKSCFFAVVQTSGKKWSPRSAPSKLKELLIQFHWWRNILLVYTIPVPAMAEDVFKDPCHHKWSINQDLHQQKPELC